MATLRTKIRHPSTDHHRHNEMHLIWAHELSNLSPGCCRSATLLHVGARACYHCVTDPTLGQLPPRLLSLTVTIEVSQQRSRSGGPRPGQRWSQGFGLTQWRIDANRLMRGSPSDGGIGETMFLHIFSRIDVPQINHHRASHQIP